MSLLQRSPYPRRFLSFPRLCCRVFCASCHVFDCKAFATPLRSQDHSPGEMHSHAASAMFTMANGERAPRGYLAQCPLCCSTAPVLRSTDPQHYSALNDGSYFADHDSASYFAGHDSASARADNGDAQRNAKADKAREKRWPRARAQINE